MKKENKEKKVLKKISKTKRALQEKTVTLILGGFGLVAALAWNEAIKSLFETLFKNKGTLIGKFSYASVVTIIVVIVSMQLQRLSKKNKE